LRADLEAQAARLALGIFVAPERAMPRARSAFDVAGFPAWEG
jgi:hypothetical protein